MSIDIESVPVTTLADGTDLSTLRAGGFILHGIRIELGTLDTPDITITEEPIGTTILAVTGLAADGDYTPLVEGHDDAGDAIVGSAAPVNVYGRLEIATSGGGDTKTGVVRFLVER